MEFLLNVEGLTSSNLAGLVSQRESLRGVVWTLSKNHTTQGLDFVQKPHHARFGLCPKNQGGAKLWTLSNPNTQGLFGTKSQTILPGEKVLFSDQIKFF
jgi:hypothetical protein